LGGSGKPGPHATSTCLADVYKDQRRFFCSITPSAANRIISTDPISAPYGIFDYTTGSSISFVSSLKTALERLLVGRFMSINPIIKRRSKEKSLAVFFLTLTPPPLNVLEFQPW
jgi:hypothetical protein